MSQEEGLPSILTLDRMVHEPARLAILSALSAAEEIDFLFLLKLTNLSKGNLSSHTQKLEEAGYLQTIKVFRGRTPATSFRITKEGRTALENYQVQMKAFLEVSLRKEEG
jgi:DNA-binding transcriptional ArsR family regulator